MPKQLFFKKHIYLYFRESKGKKTYNLCSFDDFFKAQNLTYTYTHKGKNINNDSDNC